MIAGPLPPPGASRMRRSCALVLLLAACGCGDASYREDMANNTVPFYEQTAELNAALAAPWQKGGITLRVPRGFNEQPAPPPPTKEELEDDFYEPPPDKRQPTYLLDPLPGLKGAWKGPLPGAGEAVGNRWLYVIDSRGLEDDPIDPGLSAENLVYEVADRFARAMNEPTPEPESFKDITFPQPPRPFARPVRYRTPQKTLVGEFGDGQMHQVDLYVHQAGPRTVIVALVMPEAAMIGPQLAASRDLMLQTLEVNAPIAAPAPSGGGAPAGGGVGF